MHLGHGEDWSRWAARSSAHSHKLQTDAVLVGKTDGNKAVCAAGGRRRSCMHPPMMGSQHQHPPSAKNMEWDCCGWGGRRDPGDGESCMESRPETDAEPPLCITHTQWEAVRRTARAAHNICFTAKLTRRGEAALPPSSKGHPSGSCAVLQTNALSKPLPCPHLHLSTESSAAAPQSCLLAGLSGPPGPPRINKVQTNAP